MKKEDFKKLSNPDLPNTKKILTNEIKNKIKRDYIIKLNYNENKFGCSPKVRESIQLNSPNIYPEYLDDEFYDDFCKISKISIDNVYFSNGSDAILDSIPKIFGPLKEHANIIIPELTYKRIEITCNIFNFNIKKVKLKDWKIDLDEMLKQIDKNTTIIYIVNPNMPTGTYNSQSDLIKFLEKVPSDILVVIDEAYIEYVHGINESFENDKKIISKFNNVIITRTFSKIFALASFRIGYCFGSKENIDILRKTNQYLPICKYSFQAAQAALKDLDYYIKLIERTKSEKERLHKELEKLNIKTTKDSFGNYIFVDLRDEKKFKNINLKDYLLDNYGILIRPVGDYAIRITIGTEEENEMLINGIKEFLKTIKW